MQLGLFPVVSLGAAATNEVAVGVCRLLHGAHKIMHMYRGPWGAAAPTAPTDAGLVTGGSLRQILICCSPFVQFYFDVTPENSSFMQQRLH